MKTYYREIIQSVDDYMILKGLDFECRNDHTFFSGCNSQCRWRDNLLSMDVVQVGILFRINPIGFVLKKENLGNVEKYINYLNYRLLMEKMVIDYNDYTISFCLFLECIDQIPSLDRLEFYYIHITELYAKLMDGLLMVNYNILSLEDAVKYMIP